eukprot:3213953-Amphidinium_carterae.1
MLKISVGRPRTKAAQAMILWMQRRFYFRIALTMQTMYFGIKYWVKCTPRCRRRCDCCNLVIVVLAVDVAVAAAVVAVVVVGNMN